MTAMFHRAFRIVRELFRRLLSPKRDLAVPRSRKWNSARLPEGERKENGVTLAMDFAEIKSLSQLGRDFAARLAKTSIPFEVFDTGCDPDAPRLPRSELPPADIPLVDHIHYRRVIVFAAGATEKNHDQFNILTPFWEFESGLPEVSPHLFDGVNHLIVFSRFCERYFSSIAPRDVGISHVRYPLPDNWRVRVGRRQVRNRLGIGEGDFVVFFHFDFRSGFDRKNPVGALKAFLAAFGNDPGAKMVVKAGGGDWDLRNRLRFWQEVRHLGIGKRLVLIEDFMPHADILDLIGASDVYLSLHRGEGLGIGMLEAMSVGTPVVATRYGGNTDFTKDENSFPVRYRMVRPATSYGLYQSVRAWPEPDVGQTAEYLRAIRLSPEMAKAKAVAADRFIRDYFSPANFESDVRSFLSATEEPSGGNRAQ